MAAEAEHDLGHAAADLARPDHTHGAAMKIEAEQTLEREIAIPDTSIRAVQFAVERKHEPYGVLGNGVRRVVRHPGYRQPQPGGRRHVDMVESGRAERDESDPDQSKHLERRRVEFVVHEAVDGCRSLGEPGGVAIEPRFEPDPFQWRARRGCGQAVAVVGLDREGGDLHGRLRGTVKG